MGCGKNRAVLLVLAAALAVALVLSLGLGQYPIPPRAAAGILAAKFLPVEPFWSVRMETVFFHVRLPRILLSCLVGACLAAAGAAYQGIFQNPMAAPDVLGASAGAAFGAALAIMGGLGRLGIACTAFLFSLGSVALALLLGRRAKGGRVLGLVLSGMVVSSLLSAGTSYLKLAADPNGQLPAITYWLMGSLSGSSPDDVWFASLPMAAGMAALLALRWQINLLTLGDAEARTMGVNAGAVRLAVIASATLITAASVSVSGMIGWVGLIVPHAARRLVGNNIRTLLPASILSGALFLLLADDLSRLLWTSEIPIGILTAFIGAPVFILLITQEGDLC